MNPKIRSNQALEYGFTSSILETQSPLNKSNIDKSTFSGIRFPHDDKKLLQDSMVSSRKSSIDSIDQTNNSHLKVNRKILTHEESKVIRKSNLKLNLSNVSVIMPPSGFSPSRSKEVAEKKSIKLKKMSRHQKTNTNILNGSNDFSSSYIEGPSTIDTSKISYNLLAGSVSSRYEHNDKSMLHDKIFHSLMTREDRYYRNLMMSKDNEMDETMVSTITDKKIKMQRHLETTRNQSIYSFDSPQEVMVHSNSTKNLPPRKFGFGSQKDEKNIKIKLSHFKLRDNFAEIVSNGLKILPKIDTVDFKNNALSPRAAEFIFPALTLNLKILDLSLNKLGEKGALSLVNHLLSGKSLIEHLNLESNDIGDIAASELLNALTNNSYIKKINLSKNGLTNNVCDALSKFLSAPQCSLQELYLHYNKIQSTGAKTVFKVLSANDSIKVLDLSWNSIGGRDEELGKSFENLFTNNKSLVHCDFSYNNISYSTTLKASAGLNDNRSILGIHWNGNQGTTDIDGYLTPRKESALDDISSNLAISKFRINGVKACIGESLKHAKSVPSENCWICGGWSEKTFSYIPGKSWRIFTGTINVHLSFDNYVAKPLIHTEDGTFAITLVVPPGTIKYFFSSNSEPFIAQDQYVIRNYPPDIKGVKIDSNTYNFVMHRLNSTKPENKSMITYVVADDYTIQTSTLPRPKKDSNLNPKTWNRQYSVFKNYEDESENLYDACFEFDWNNTRMTRLSNDDSEIASVFEYLKSQYKFIKDTYRHFASLDPIDNVFCITEKSFEEFIRSSRILNDDSEFDEVIANMRVICHYSAKTKLEPEHALVRHQFMETIVRIGLDKYMKNKIGVRMIQAVKKIFSNDLAKPIKAYDPREWRINKLWNEKCDFIIRSYMTILKYCFEKYSYKPDVKIEGNHQNESQEEAQIETQTQLEENKYIILSGFEKLCYDLDISSNGINNKDIKIAFNYSMILKIDEINQDRHLKMSLLEFIEAFARIADIASLKPFVLEENENQIISSNDIPLEYKIEGLIIKAYKNCLAESERKSFLLPEKPISDTLN